MILKAKNIKKSFSYPVELDLLKGVDLEVKMNESVAIMGRSGEGKSTLLNILGTLEGATSGELYISNKLVEPSSCNKIRNLHIGFVFQGFHLLGDYTVLQNVLMPAKIARFDTTKGKEAYQRAEDLLVKVGLKERLHHFGKQLSGGEKQRVAIARALCNDPELILADEPTGNLDKKTAEGIQELLFQFVKEGNKALVVVTHDQELAELCDSKYRLELGLLSK